VQAAKKDGNTGRKKNQIGVACDQKRTGKAKRATNVLRQKRKKNTGVLSRKKKNAKSKTKHLLLRGTASYVWKEKGKEHNTQTRERKSQTQKRRPNIGTISKKMANDDCAEKARHRD